MNYKCSEVSIKNIATEITISKLEWEFTWRSFIYMSIISTIIISLFTTPISPYTMALVKYLWNRMFLVTLGGTIGTILLTKIYFGLI